MNLTPIPEPVQSYPTFWDAVPVEDAPPPAPAPAPPAGEPDAYTLFSDAADVTHPPTLSVEQTDVG